MHANFVRWFNEGVKGSKIPQVRSLSERRVAMIDEIHKRFTAQQCNEALWRAVHSRFLNGHGKKGFQVTFDWLFRVDNFVKVLEGNYQSRAEPP